MAIAKEIETKQPIETLTVEFKNTAPLELNEFASGITALGDNFKHNLSENPLRYPYEAGLYIKEVRQGSIIIDLMTFAAALTAPTETISTLTTFALKFKDLVEFLRDKKGKKNQFTRADFSQIAEVLKTTAHDQGAVFNFFTVNSGSGTVNLSIDSGEAQRLRQNAFLEKNKLEQPVPSVYEQVVLRFYQARNKIGNKTGDMGIIESLHTRPVKVIFMDEKVKSAIMKGDDNVFKSLYLVNVRVERVDGKPVLYKVEKVIETWATDE